MNRTHREKILALLDYRINWLQNRCADPKNVTAFSMAKYEMMTLRDAIEDESQADRLLDVWER